MPYNVKKSKNINCKFKSLSVVDDKSFVDNETGQLIDLASIVAKTIGNGEPVDVTITNKDEEDITPDSVE